jgi:PAS domain S-box-containing protein
MTQRALGPGVSAPGQMARRISAFDWTGTPVGPAAGWPQPLRTLLDVMMGSNQAMFIAWGPELTLLYNDAYAEILAGKHPEALGRPFLKVWPEIRDDLVPIVGRALRGEPVQMDDITLMIHRRGFEEETHFAFSYTPIRDESGDIGGIFCVCQETTAQVLAERRLRASEAAARTEAERVRLALDAGAILGTWFWDLPQDRFTVDDGFARSFGLDPCLGREGLSLEEVSRTVHPDDRPGLMEAIAEAVERGGRYAHQYRVRRADGRYYWIEANGRVDKGPDGTPLSFPGVLLDIEERRRAEENLREATRRFDAILSNTREAVFLMDDRQHCIYANAAAEKLTGYRFEEMRGRPLHDVVHHTKPDGSHYPLEDCPIDRAFPERALTSGEEVFVAPDGSFYPVAFTASPVLDDVGQPIGTVIEARNITEEKAQDAALRESEARFRNMADHAPVMMWVTDATGSCIYLNRIWHEFTGQSEDEALGLGWLEATHPEDRAEAGRIFLESTERRAPFRIEYRLKRADGAWRWAIDAAAPRFGPTGEFLGFIGSVIDITDRKVAEEELRARTAEIEAILAAAPLGIAFFDREHRWLRINDELAAINGFAPEAHIGRRMDELLPFHAHRVMAVLDRVFATGEPVRNVEVTGEVASAPGTRRDWLVNYYPVRDAEGRITAVGTWVVDITERKEAEARARESEARLRAVIEAAPVGLVFCDATGRITGGNSRVEEIVGHAVLPSAGVNEYRDWVSFHPNGRQVEGREYPLARVLKGEERPELDALYRRGDGRLAWIKFIASAVRDAEGQIAGGVVASLDVDRERRAEAELRALNETLERRIDEAVAKREAAEEALRQSQKMEAVGQLTGGIAHDFNNMLAAVVGSLDLLGRRIGEEDARSRRYVDTAMEGARRAATLTQRLLAFARRQPLRPETVDANRLVQGMLDLLSRSLGAGVRIETVLGSDLWLTHADPNQLENVILNLAVNARDAMPEGGQLVIETSNTEVGAEPAGLAPGDYVQIAVRDAGVGMSPEVMAKAFDPFFTTKPVGQGTGLGLSQVYGFVRQSGGQVVIESKLGQGTTVRIYLPRRPATEAEAPMEVLLPELPPGEAQEVVLVVEDEEVVRRFTVEALSELGYRVLEASGGPAALRLLEAHPEIALLFTDIVMPDMNGRKLAEEALRRRCDLKVLFTTGYTGDAEGHGGMPEPGMELIGKPFTVEDLASKMRRVLDGS